MTTAEEIRSDIKSRLGDIVSAVNAALSGGESLVALAPTLERLGRGGRLPHWYATLESDGALPNLDGKSLGSVLEMVFVAVLENRFYYDTPIVPLQINPARGVDIPAIKLGVKSPSENYCTSEPFFSAYERLIGNEHDAVILLTDYQSRKSTPPLRIQVIRHAYLAGSQIADHNLCKVARRQRDALLLDHVSELKKIIRFLVYVNQSDFEAKALLKILGGDLNSGAIRKSLQEQIEALLAYNKSREQNGKERISDDCLQRLAAIADASPLWLSLVNAADNWVIETHKDFGRYPNDSEWERLVRGQLDGQIGMSFALQWRYNFGPLFRM